MFVYRLGYILTLFILVPVLTSWINLSDNTIAIIACLLSATGEVGGRGSLSEGVAGSGFILPAVTGTTVWAEVSDGFLGHFVLNWFSVGSLLCLLAPVTTITTRWVLQTFL